MPVSGLPGAAFLGRAVQAYFALAPPAWLPLSSEILKAPAILADLASVAILYSIVVRFASDRQALFAAQIAAVAPWTWTMSESSGQTISIAAMFLLLTLDLACEDRYTESWVALAAAALFAPLPLAVAPIVLAAQLREQSFGARTLYGPALGSALAYSASFYLAPSPWPVPTFAYLAHLYHDASRPTLTSFGAANIWTLFTHAVPDTRAFYGVTLQAFGWIVFAIVETFVVATMLRRFAVATTRVVRLKLFVDVWFLVCFAAFVVLTRERQSDLGYALAFVPALWQAGERERRIACVLAVTFVANFALTFASDYRHLFVPTTPLANVGLHVLAFANVVTLVYALDSYRAGIIAPPVKDEFALPVRLP